MRKVETLEAVVKGFANKRRIAIMQLLSRQPDLDVELVAERICISYTSAAAHLRKLHGAGIISKREDGYFVLHRLTPRGRQILTFLHRL